MTIRLRPHHLLCLLTYVGKGYSPAFTVNYDAIAGRIAQGETIVLVEGPDDICAPLLGEAEPHCWRDSVTHRDRQAARDLNGLLAQPIEAGAIVTLSAQTIRLMRAAFADGTPRQACHGCEWNSLCSAIAAGGYQGARVPAATP